MFKNLPVTNLRQKRDQLLWLYLTGSPLLFHETREYEGWWQSYTFRMKRLDGHAVMLPLTRMLSLLFFAEVRLVTREVDSFDNIISNVASSCRRY